MGNGYSGNKMFLSKTIDFLKLNVNFTDDK